MGQKYLISAVLPIKNMNNDHYIKCAYEWIIVSIWYCCNKITAPQMMKTSEMKQKRQTCGWQKPTRFCKFSANYLWFLFKEYSVIPQIIYLVYEI